MRISKIIFTDRTSNKVLGQTYTVEAGESLILPTKGDLWGFEAKGDEIKYYVVETRQFEEQADHSFSCTVVVTEINS